MTLSLPVAALIQSQSFVVTCDCVLWFDIVTVHKTWWYKYSRSMYKSIVLYDCGLLDIPKKQRHYEFHLWLWECNGSALLCVTIYNTKIKSNRISRRRKKKRRKAEEIMSGCVCANCQRRKTIESFPSLAKMKIGMRAQWDERQQITNLLSKWYRDTFMFSTNEKLHRHEKHEQNVC